jgi:hypothetical protein
MTNRKKTTEIGYANRNGQVVIRATGLPGTDHLQYIYQLACTGCGENYGANGSDLHERKCPLCQGGEPGLPYDTGPANNEAELLIYGEVQKRPLFLPIGDVARFARIQYAIKSSRTWAEFIERLPKGEYERDDESTTFEAYCESNSLDPKDPKSRASFLEDETVEFRRPLPEELFDPFSILAMRMVTGQDRTGRRCSIACPGERSMHAEERSHQ